jgi:hypothetical protein
MDMQADLVSSKPETQDTPGGCGKPTGVSAAGYSLLHVGVRAFTAFGDEAVDPRRDNGQRYRAELEHSIVECADVEFRSEHLLRFFASTHDRERKAAQNLDSDGAMSLLASSKPSTKEQERPLD